MSTDTKSKIISCDWCDDQAIFFFEIMKNTKKHGRIGTAVKWYGCPRHERQLRDVADSNKSPVCSMATGQEIH